MYKIVDCIGIKGGGLRVLNPRIRQIDFRDSITHRTGPLRTTSVSNSFVRTTPLESLPPVILASCSGLFTIYILYPPGAPTQAFRALRLLSLVDFHSQEPLLVANRTTLKFASGVGVLLQKNILRVFFQVDSPSRGVVRILLFENSAL